MKAEEKGLEVLFRTDPSVPTHLVGDPLRLGQILLNLASNAVKFTEQGEIVVSTQVAELDDERAVLEFTVSDTGIGMTPEQVARLFQPFSPGRHLHHPEVRRHRPGPFHLQAAGGDDGGQIRVESEPGKGSVFRFTATFGLERQVKGPFFQSDRRLRGSRVLVVDDSETSREILGESLRAMTFDVQLAASGDEALVELDRAADEAALTISS